MPGNDKFDRLVEEKTKFEEIKGHDEIMQINGKTNDGKINFGKKFTQTKKTKPVPKTLKFPKKKNKESKVMKPKEVK